MPDFVNFPKATLSYKIYLLKFWEIPSSGVLLSDFGDLVIWIF